MKSLNPIGQRKVGLKEKGTNNIIRSAKHAFGLAILLGGVWAGHAEVDTMGKKESMSGGIVKFTTIVALEALNGSAELGGNKREKARNSAERVGFEAERKSPQVMRTIIENGKVIFEAGDTRNWRSPKITVYEIKIM
jgi:hypothetical protein